MGFKSNKSLENNNNDEENENNSFRTINRKKRESTIANLKCKSNYKNSKYKRNNSMKKGSYIPV